MDEQQNYLINKGARIWFKRTGCHAGPPLIFLHGGPGYNGYSFEQTAGFILESKINMIYMDQRGCGRSSALDAAADLTVDAIVDDIEALRGHLGLEKFSLVGHSFGGLVAIEYLNAFPERVAKLVLVETTPNLVAAVEHQLTHIFREAPRVFPEQCEMIAEIAKSGQTALDKLRAIHHIVDEQALYLELFWYDQLGMEKNISVDRASGFYDPRAGSLAEGLRRSGYLEDSHPELQQTLSVPGVLFAGRASQCFAAKDIEAAAKDWGIRLQWFNRSGHMPYIEETELFCENLFSFMFPGTSGGSPGASGLTSI